MKIIFEDKTKFFRKSYFYETGDYVTMKKLLKLGENYGFME